MNTQSDNTPKSSTCNHQEDVSLRDYFAGQALMGLVVHNNYGSVSDANIAKGAYLYADAMLEARTLNYQP